MGDGPVCQSSGQTITEFLRFQADHELAQDFDRGRLQMFHTQLVLNNLIGIHFSQNTNDERQPPCPAPTTMLAGSSNRSEGVARLEVGATGSAHF